jgi:Flp pilus assembly protein TadD
MTMDEIEERRLRRARELHSDDPVAHNDLGNLLFARGDITDAIDCYRAALAAAPDHVDIHFNLANALAESGDSAAALTSYRRALALDAAHVGAHNNLGNLLRKLHRPANALECYRRALHLRPQDATTRYNLGTALLDLHRAEEALTWFEQAARAKEPHLPAIASTGEALLRLGRAQEALQWFREAQRLRPGDLQARLGEGFALLTLGRFREGWQSFEARLEDPRVGPSMPAGAGPPWRGIEEVRGRTMLIYAEQGSGDTIQFARYLPLLRARGARVVLRAQTPLFPLLRPLADSVIDKTEQLPEFDFHSPLMSLPLAFGTELASIPAEIPYMFADPRRVARWRRRLGARQGRRVGIAFSGNPDHMLDALRSIPAADFAPVLRCKGIDFHVLQTQIRPADAAALHNLPRVHLHADALHDFADTAALLTLMDLVISVDTSVAHLAGAMGRPVWILLQYNADFRWMQQRDDTPWYPTARLFRQQTMRRWQPVIDAVAAALVRPVR